MPGVCGRPSGRTRPEIEAVEGATLGGEAEAEFACAGTDFKRALASRHFAEESLREPAVVAHREIDEAQVAPVVQGVGMVGRERIEELGLKFALHEERKVAQGRGLVQIRGNAMDPIPRPVDLIAQATEQFAARPTWDEYFMATAKLIASRSNCERLNVGCVIVTGGERKNRLVAAGYNGFLPGTPHASRLRDGHEQATVHAEQNAIADAARRGSSVEGCTAYVTHYPCINCAKILAASGIAEIKYHEDYQNDPLVAPILGDAQVKISKL